MYSTVYKTQIYIVTSALLQVRILGRDSDYVLYSVLTVENDAKFCYLEVYFLNTKNQIPAFTPMLNCF